MASRVRGLFDLGTVTGRVPGRDEPGHVYTDV